MKYEPDCYIYGTLISLISLGVFVVLFAYELCLRRGFLHLKEGGFAARLADIFFYTEQKTPEDPDYLSDEYLDALDAARAEKRRSKQAENGEGCTAEGDAIADAAQDAPADTDTEEVESDDR